MPHDHFQNFEHAQIFLSDCQPVTIAHEVSRTHYDHSMCALAANHELSRVSHSVVDRCNVVNVGV